MMNLKFFDAVFLSVRLITATAITAFLLSIPPRLTTGVMTYVFHTRCGCIPCGLSILLSPPRRACRKGVGCSHRQCYRLFNACSTGPTHQACLTAYRRVGDLRSIHRVPNLTDNGVLMVHRVWSDRFRCTKANQPNFRLRKKQIPWDRKKDSSFYKPRLKSISVVGN